MRTRTDLSSVLRVVSLVYLLHNFQKYPGKNTYVNIRLFPNWILKRLLTGHFGRHVVFLVVSQVYETDVNKEYTIRGNSAILKCQIPSFVADFVSVISWHTDQDEVFTYQTEDGNYVCPLPCPLGKFLLLGALLWSLTSLVWRIFLFNFLVLFWRTSIPYFPSFTVFCCPLFPIPLWFLPLSTSY